MRPAEVVAWFRERYPKLQPATVRAHVKGLTANDNSRHHYKWLVHREPLFTRDADGTLHRYEPPEPPAGDGDEPTGERESEELRFEFALEAALEGFLLSNWAAVDWGRPLEIWGDADAVGHQLRTPVGVLDFLCRDTSTDALVVVELKRGRPSDRVVGQAARYMGWVRANLARDGQPVEGLIIAAEQDERLAYAVSAVPELSVLTYAIDFTLTGAAPPQARPSGPLANELRLRPGAKSDRDG